MRGRKDSGYYLVKAAQGALLSILILTVIFIKNRDGMFDEFLLNETLPYYGIHSDINTAFDPEGDEVTGAAADAGGSETSTEIIKLRDNPEDSAGILDSNADMSAPSTSRTQIEKFPVVIIEEEPVFRVKEIEATQVEPSGGIIGVDDVIYQPEHFTVDLDGHFSDSLLVDRDKLTDINYLLQNFYLVDKATGIKNGLIDPIAFLDADLSVRKDADGPQVLVFHTHSQELYRDSNGTMEGVVGLGEHFCQLLESKYGIKTMHDMSVYDMVDGTSHILGAYERMEPNVMKILRDNPTIEVVIDLHRDGVAESIRLVETINGKPTAQVMFFNGLSTLNDNGTLRDISSLPNPNLKGNLAFSFQMQLAANQLFEGFTRKVYLQAYRYSLHMLPKSLLIEVGAQTNTKEEAFNAVEPLADTLASVILRK